MRFQVLCHRVFIERIDADRVMIDELVRRNMKEDHTPGMAVAITNREGLLHLSNYGFANRDSREPVTAERVGNFIETLFGLAPR